MSKSLLDFAALAEAAQPGFPAGEFEAALAHAAPEKTLGGDVLVRGEGKLLLRLRPYGTVVFYDPREENPERLLALSENGEILERVSWKKKRLDEARLRLPDGGWLFLRAGGALSPLWGESDQIFRGKSEEGPWEKLTITRSISWESPREIPPGEEPVKLAGGGGAVLLNFIASLMVDRGAGSARYRGPYPTDQLFDSLLASFGVEGEPSEARTRFTEKFFEVAFEGKAAEPAVDFRPHPFELLPLPGGALLARERFERLYWEGLSYNAAAGTKRLWHDGDRWMAGLFCLGRPLEIHAELDWAGRHIAARTPKKAVPQKHPAFGEWREALSLLVLAGAAMPLWPSVFEVFESRKISFGMPRKTLSEVTEKEILLRDDLLDAFAVRAAGVKRRERIDAALALLTEIAADFSPQILAVAQERLAQAGAEERSRLLSPQTVAALRKRAEEKAPALARLCAQIAEEPGAG
ncbi:MAG: hypothetical protein AB1405_07315 [Bdellovibrionota bacterium]